MPRAETCLQSIQEGRVSLCFVLIDENVPVDPAVEGAGERIRIVLRPQFIASPSRRLRSSPAPRAGPHLRPSLGWTSCPSLAATRCDSQEAPPCQAVRLSTSRGG